MVMLKKLLTSIVLFACYAYALGAMAAIPYFNWQYAHDHGFARWVLLGELVATAKGLAWPYFAVGGRSPTRAWTAEEKENIRHFFTSMDATQAATRLGNAGGGYSFVPEATVQEMYRLRQEALREAVMVRDDVLEKAAPGLSVQWRQKHQRGLELQLMAVERRDASAEIAGSALHNDWIDWINSNKAKVLIPK